jgi:tetratricopeptide (TPR) repeat protein
MPEAMTDKAPRPLEVRRHGIRYPSGWAAFEQGDYFYAATHAGEDQRLKGAALIMMGHHEGGLPLLEGFEDPTTCYYRAVALWGYGENGEALSWIRRGLRPSDLDPATRRRLADLHTLIAGGPIRVLVQARNAAPPSSFGIVTAMKASPHFEVRSIGYQESDDVQLEPYEDLAHVLGRLPSGWVPRFFHCYQVDSNLMPVGLEQAPFPIIGYVSDYDTRVHTCFYRAKACDAIVAAGGVDHYELSHGFGLPSVVFPKVVGIDAAVFSRTDFGRKDWDVFSSGTAMTFYQNDKGTLVYRLTQLGERFRVRIHQGFMESSCYVEQVARAKAVFSFVRRQPVWSSRALEALGGGAVALYQEGGGLELFLGEDEGAVPYREDNLEAVVARVIDRWDDTYCAAALRGRARVLREFDLKVCMDRYMKRLALLAGDLERTRRTRRGIPLEANLRYPPTSRGSFVASKSVRKRIWASAFATTVPLLRSVAKERRGANYDNICAFAYFMLGHRDSDFYSLYWKLIPHQGTREYFAKAVATLEEACGRHPRDLLLSFNLGRLCYHTGRIDRAYEVFTRIRSMPTVQFNPLIDLYGEDFGEMNFSFRAYVDRLIHYLVSKEERWLDQMAAIVLASIWHYCGLIEHKRGQAAQSLHSLRRCLRLFSDHACYQEQYAGALWDLAKHDPSARVRAIDHLDQAWRISPYCSGLLVKLTVWNHQMGRTDDAERWLACHDRFAKCMEGWAPADFHRRVLDKVRLRMTEDSMVTR